MKTRIENLINKHKVETLYAESAIILITIAVIAENIHLILMKSLTWWPSTETIMESLAMTCVITLIHKTADKLSKGKILDGPYGETYKRMYLIQTGISMCISILTVMLVVTLHFMKYVPMNAMNEQPLFTAMNIIYASNAGVFMSTAIIALKKATKEAT